MPRRSRSRSRSRERPRARRSSPLRAASRSPKKAVPDSSRSEDELDAHEEFSASRALRDQKQRRYRKKNAEGAATRKANEPSDAELLDGQAQARVKAAVEAAAATALDQPEVQQRLQARLIEERAKLEDKVTQQLEEERQALLARKRAEQEEALRRQLELDRILQENHRKLEEAQRKARAPRQRSVRFADGNADAEAGGGSAATAAGAGADGAGARMVQLGTLPRGAEDGTGRVAPGPLASEEVVRLGIARPSFTRL